MKWNYKNIKFKIQTKGHYDFVDITDEVAAIVKKSGVKEGIAIVFVSGSTAALTMMEYEDGLIEDMKEMFEKLAPEDFDYKHHIFILVDKRYSYISSSMVRELIGLGKDVSRYVPDYVNKLIKRKFKLR